MSSAELSPVKLESIPEQRAKTNRLLSLINLASVNRLTESIGYKTIGLQKHELYGVINLIYFVEVENSLGKTEFVLRVTNPWSRWSGRLPRNEAAVLGAIQRWNEASKDPARRIPAPKILAFSADSNTSLLGCEFSLAEKLPGANGSATIAKLSPEQRQILWSDFLRAHSNLASIPLSYIFPGKDESEVVELSSMIGSFCNWPEGLGPLILDGPGIGPSKSYGALMVDLLRKSLGDLDTCETLSLSLDLGEIDTLKERLSNLLHKLDSGEINMDKIWPSTGSLALCHDDLHPGNILVDPETGHLTGLLDWDRVQWGLHADQAREWCICMADNLFGPPCNDEDCAAEGDENELIPTPNFDDALLLKAMKELDEVYPESLQIKLRDTWSSLPMNVTWMTNFLSSWIGPQKTDADGNPLPDNIKSYTKHHRTHWKASIHWLDHLDGELKKGESSFSTCPEYSDSDDSA